MSKETRTMKPHVAAELASATVSDHDISDIAGAEAGIIGALLEALNGSGEYQLVERDGELFLEPSASSHWAHLYMRSASPKTR
jgi:hypothetical protein